MPKYVHISFQSWLHLFVGFYSYFVQQSSLAFLLPTERILSHFLLSELEIAEMWLQ